MMLFSMRHISANAGAVATSRVREFSLRRRLSPLRHWPLLESAVSFARLSACLPIRPPHLVALAHHRHCERGPRDAARCQHPHRSNDAWGMCERTPSACVTGPWRAIGRESEERRPRRHRHAWRIHLRRDALALEITATRA